MAETKTLFAVVQDPDGTISVDWHRDLYPLLDDDGRTTDRVIDLAEEILRENEEE